jgi:hypothetical protein
MIEFLSLAAHILVSPFKTRARLEAEIILLRHQVNVLRRRLLPKPKLTVADRLIFVWLNWLFPSVRRAITIIQPETESIRATPSSSGSCELGSRRVAELHAGGR